MRMKGIVRRLGISDPVYLYHLTADRVNRKPQNSSSGMNDSMKLEIVKLHDHEDLIKDVVKVLNLEWPRSESARVHSLNDSRDDLPCSLLLINKHDDGIKEVIGHSKLSKVHGKQKSVFLENVIIEKTKRGCGLGRKLMELTELHVSKLGYRDIYLSTHDKCKFYEYLGYVYSSPVSPIRANAKLLTPEQFSALQIHFGEQNEPDSKESNKLNTQDEENSIAKSMNDDQKLEAQSICNTAEPPSLPPPPPPPLPALVYLGEKISNNCESEKQYWMVKHLKK